MSDTPINDYHKGRATFIPPANALIKDLERWIIQTPPWPWCNDNLGDEAWRGAQLHVQSLIDKHKKL